MTNETNKVQNLMPVEKQLSQNFITLSNIASSFLHVIYDNNVVRNKTS